jgi:hypothetical protein
LDHASWELREVVKRIVDSEISNSRPTSPVTFPSIEIMSQHLSVQIGPGSFRSLLARSLMRSTAEVPWLGALRVGAEGQLVGLSAARERYSAAEISKAEGVLLIHFLQLLVSFIGPTLVLKFCRQMWPQISFTYTAFRNAEND